LVMHEINLDSNIQDTPEEFWWVIYIYSLAFLWPIWQTLKVCEYSDLG
jgi:hypothetical protein